MAFRFSKTCAVCLLGAMWSSAQSARIEYTVGVGVNHNDNINLSEDDPVGDTILQPSLAFTLAQDGSAVQAAADGIFQYRDFLQGHFGDDFRGQLNGRLNWSVLPGWLDFGVEDYMGVQSISTLAADTPDNQQQTNVFAVGPTFTFALGPTMRGQAELRYTNSYAETTDAFNSDRITAALRAIKDLSPGSAIAANVVDERIRFRDSDIDPDYSRYSAFGRYTRKWTELDLSADLGYSWLNYSDHASALPNRDDALLRANLGWHVTANSTLTFAVAHQLSDAASGLLAGSAIAVDHASVIPAQIVTGTATTTSAAYLENRIDAGYSYQGVRAGFAVAPYFRKLDYGAVATIGTLGDAINQTARGATLNVSWLLQPLLAIGMSATGENVRYDSLARTDKTWQVQAFMRQQFTRHWSWRVDLTRYQRDSTTPGLNADQNIVSAEITYAR
jgi:hypothetical protein